MNTIERIKFISECKSAGINSGRKLTYAEVLEREIKKGNEKAKAIYEKWKDKL